MEFVRDGSVSLETPVMKVGQDFFQGCGFVFDTPNGHFLEYTLGDLENGEYEVYRVHLSHDISKQFASLLRFGQGISFCKTLNVLPEVWLRKSRGTVAQRVECLMDVAAVFGWEVIDEDPIQLTELELKNRWNYIRESGPVTTAGSVMDTVRELLIALLHENPEAHWDLFNRDFPLIPSEPLSNPDHPWWEKHGQDAEKILVQQILQNTPKGMVFEKREGRWGFWYS